MTATGHFIFSLAVVIFAKKTEIISSFSQGNWGHIIIGSILGCLLPDIDHPKSWLGKRVKILSIPISRIFGHRGFTHSILSLIICITILMKTNIILQLALPKEIIDSITLSYISHIFADMLTPSGVPFFWPFLFRFKIPLLKNSNHKKSKEKIFCILLLIASFLYSSNKNIMHFIPKNIINELYLKYINFFQYQTFNHVNSR